MNQEELEVRTFERRKEHYTQSLEIYCFGVKLKFTRMAVPTGSLMKQPISTDKKAIMTHEIVIAASKLQQCIVLVTVTYILLMKGYKWKKKWGESDDQSEQKITNKMIYFESFPIIRMRASFSALKREFSDFIREQFCKHE